MPKNNTLSKELFAVCIYFAECFLYDTWQRPYLLSARKNTLGKDSALGKYQVSRSVRGECAWVVSVWVVLCNLKKLEKHKPLLLILLPCQREPCLFPLWWTNKAWPPGPRWGFASRHSILPPSCRRFWRPSVAPLPTQIGWLLWRMSTAPCWKTRPGILFLAHLAPTSSLGSRPSSISSMLMVCLSGTRRAGSSAASPSAQAWTSTRPSIHLSSRPQFPSCSLWYHVSNVYCAKWMDWIDRGAQRCTYTNGIL